MNVRKIAAVLLLSAVLGTGGFFAGRLLVNGGGTEAQQPSLIDQLEAIATQEQQLRAEPRFVGELLGIHLAPSLDQLPLEVREEAERLTAGGCAGIPVEQASALDFPRPLVMPEGYVLDDQDPHGVGTNPSALACSGRPSFLGTQYRTTGTEAIPATVSIVRSTLNYDTQDVAVSQVSTQVIGGREAVVIRPASPDGLAQRILVYFPEPFGQTAIHAFNLPEVELLRVAEAVAEATQ